MRGRLAAANTRAMAASRGRSAAESGGLHQDEDAAVVAATAPPANALHKHGCAARTARGHRGAVTAF